MEKAGGLLAGSAFHSWSEGYGESSGMQKNWIGKGVYHNAIWHTHKIYMICTNQEYETLPAVLFELWEWEDAGGREFMSMLL